MPDYEVCPECRGEGSTSRIGAFTASDVDEWYGDDAGAREDFIDEYMTRGGVYDEKCPLCKGERVVSAADLKRAEEEYDPEAAAEAAYFGSLGY